jgi:GNAT superfamily N-acetyltransferase
MGGVPVLKRSRLHVRGRGIGMAALDRVKQQAASLGIAALHLEAARTNERAKRLRAQSDFRSRERFQLMTCCIRNSRQWS